MAQNGDVAAQKTDEELAKLQRKIERLYKGAFKEMTATQKKTLKEFQKQQESAKKELDDGKITEQKYNQIMLDNLRRSEQMQAVIDGLAERMTNANEVAVAYVNDTTPGIYTLNHNFTAYTIEESGENVAFNIYHEQTVKNLIMNNPKSMPYYPKEKAVQRGIDLRYGQRQINNALISGILQGKSIPKIQADLMKRCETMGEISAMRAARTAATSAQNAGRMAAYKHAEEMGIKVRKRWLAAKDTRTRDSHAKLDGETINYDTKFSNGLMFPGDPDGKPAEVYNCRCTLVTVEKEGIVAEPIEMRARDPVTGKNVVMNYKTYKEWEAEKIAEGKIIDKAAIKAEKAAKAAAAEEARIAKNLEKLPEIKPIEFLECYNNGELQRHLAKMEPEQAAKWVKWINEADYSELTAEELENHKEHFNPVTGFVKLQFDSKPEILIHETGHSIQEKAVKVTTGSKNRKRKVWNYDDEGNRTTQSVIDLEDEIFSSVNSVTGAIRDLLDAKNPDWFIEDKKAIFKWLDIPCDENGRSIKENDPQIILNKCKKRFDEIKKKYGEECQSDLSDMLDAYFYDEQDGLQISGLIHGGHGNDYWMSNMDHTYAESWAETCNEKVLGNEDFLKLLHKIIPNKSTATQQVYEVAFNGRTINELYDHNENIRFVSDTFLQIEPSGL